MYGAYPPAAGAYPPGAPGAYPPGAPGAYPPGAPGAYPPGAPGMMAPGMVRPAGPAMWYDNIWGCAPLGQSIEGEFFRLDRDRSGTVDIYEMRNFRVATRSLSQEAIRAVFHIFAEPTCGQITINLFRRMYNFVMACDNVFRQMSFGRPEISFEQVAPAIAQLQIPAPPPAVMWVVARIDSRHCSPNRMVSFNEFILVVAFFASARSIFQRIDRDRNGTITLNEMDFMNTVAGLP